MTGLATFSGRRFLDTGIAGIHNMFDDFFRDNRFPPRSLMNSTFKLDIAESEREYMIIAEIPGFSKDDISLDLNENRLTITANKVEETNNENSDSGASGEKCSYIHRERRSSSMSRSIYLPDISGEEIKAKLDSGILTVTVPKQNKKDTSCKITIE